MNSSESRASVVLVGHGIGHGRAEEIDQKTGPEEKPLRPTPKSGEPSCGEMRLVIAKRGHS